MRCLPVNLLPVGGLLFITVLMASCLQPKSDYSASNELPEQVSYNFDIRPILSDKCLSCHGPDSSKRKAGLRLDLPESAYQALKEHPGAHAIVPGSPQTSMLFMSITSKDSSKLMPPPSSNLTLTKHEIALLEKWIEQGAKYEKHWAFVPVQQPELPKVKNQNWCKNEIDHFILAKLEQQKLKPNKETDRERLLKRVCIDLTGLPPTVAQMDAFLNDQRPDAYEKMIDELLQQPAYGEKMALHWLDLARYADSHGYQDDGYRTQWPWRDWVIHAYNKNMSYKDFVTWQLAGDLLPNAGKEQLLATAFNRNHKITEEGGVIPEEYRTMYVSDRTDLLGKGLMGVTLECARCHDHKYDPFTQKDYYQLFAFFNNVKEAGIESVIGGPETYAKKPLMEISNTEVRQLLHFINKPDTHRLIVSVMGDLDTIRPTVILNRGQYDMPGDTVVPGTPASILPFSDKYPANRLGLANWLFDPKHPLTARFYVNLLWQEFFGKGLVKTTGDFGMQGELPSHPALLDWLAYDFIQHNWNIKRLVKMMVSSATYRQAATITPDQLARDPENTWLSRGPRYRIAAELIRDLVLSSSGLLNKSIGGPSVKPYQPPGLWEGATSGRGLLSVYQQDHGALLYRRGMYTLIKRTVPPPSMIIFDASNRDICEVKRLKTNTPLQALVMMNDPAVLEASRVLAARLINEKNSPETAISKAFRTIVCRKPTAQELKILTDYHQRIMMGMEEKQAVKLLSVGEYPIPVNINKKELASLMRIVNTIYNMEETITKS